MDRYDAIRCKDLVYGYFNPKPLERAEPAFDRAKAELVQQLERQLELVKAYSFEQYKGKSA